MSTVKVYNTGESEEQLREKYNPDGSLLRKAQLRMVEMLSFLDEICSKNGITYYIAFGTLLGAVRHSGFIPWDDDLDVYISAKDIRKLRKIINNGNYPYVVQCHSNDKGFVRYYNVLRDLKSEYIKNEYQHNQRKYRGIQIDLFPYEFGVLEGGKRIVAKTIGLNERYFLGRNKILCGMVFHLTNGFIIPLLKFCSLFKEKKYVSLGYEGLLPGHKFLKDEVFPLKRIDFEGLSVPCPKNPEYVLTVDYGENFDDLPNIDSRDHHKVLNINFLE